MPGPVGFAPPIPGTTETNGLSPDMLSPMAMMMMAAGMDTGKDTTGKKMETVIKLMREIQQSDPRMAPLLSDALRLLIEGPSQGQGPPGAGPGMGMPPGVSPSGGPGGMVA